MKLSFKSIPAAAAITATLMFGAQAQAQTSPAPPTTAAGDKAPIPAGPNATPKTMQQRDAAKPMAKSGGAAASMGTGDSAATPQTPVREATKKRMNKAERTNKNPAMQAQ